MKKNCEICDKEFEGQYYNSNTCSEVCKNKRAYLLARKRRGTPDRICVLCGDELDNLRRTYCESISCKDIRREKLLAAKRKYAAQPEIKDRYKKYRKNNPKMYSGAAAKWRANNRESFLLALKKWNDKNRDLPQYRINNRIRANVFKTLKRRGLSKGGKTFEILGYSKYELKETLESQFIDGMSWDNMGEWHIDHIRPISSFNYDSTDHPDFKKCWALNNLQPLWAFDNMSKRNKWDGVVNA